MKQNRSGTVPVSRETEPRARLEELRIRYSLSAPQTGQLASLLDFLAASPAPPTTVTDFRQAVDVHVADSLTALSLDEFGTPAVIADLGAGAGFPALVLAVARPQARVVAIESASRKCRFIGSAAEHIGLDNVDVVCTRAESWTDGLGSCEIVCARALAPLGVLCEYAAPLLRPGGALVAWKAALSDAETRAARAACARLGLSAPEELPVEPYPGSRNHALFKAVKVGDTPAGFPRRPGMAVKRPLG